MVHLPKNNPIQFATALVNKDKEPTPITVLRTRVSKAGRYYLRLPDGTLPVRSAPHVRTCCARALARPCDAFVRRVKTPRVALFLCRPV